MSGASEGATVLRTIGSALRQLGPSVRPSATHRRGARWGHGRCHLCPRRTVRVRAVGRRLPGDRCAAVRPGSWGGRSLPPPASHTYTEALCGRQLVWALGVLPGSPSTEPH
eukprot:3367544-Alexandrium_andersonii.AAC.1